MAPGTCRTFFGTSEIHGLDQPGLGRLLQFRDHGLIEFARPGGTERRGHVDAARSMRRSSARIPDQQPLRDRACVRPQPRGRASCAGQRRCRGSRDHAAHAGTLVGPRPNPVGRHGAFPSHARAVSSIRLASVRHARWRGVSSTGTSEPVAARPSPGQRRGCDCIRRMRPVTVRSRARCLWCSASSVAVSRILRLTLLAPDIV